MEPTSPAPTPNQSSIDPNQPVQPATPDVSSAQPTAAPTVGQQPMGGSSMNGSMPSSGGNKTPLIIGIVVAVFVLLGGGLLAATLLKSKKDDTSNKTTNSADTKTTTSPTPTLACLAQDDYKYMSYDKQPSSVTYDLSYNPDEPTFNYVAMMFFKPDKTDEDSLTSIYDDWAEFAQKNENKEWKFRLEGTTYGADNATPEAQKLANARSAKVQAELEKRGVPSSRFIIEKPRSYIDEQQDDALAQIYRAVEVTIDPTCNTSSASPSNSDR